MGLSKQFKVTGDYGAKGTAGYIYDPTSQMASWHINASAYGYPLVKSGTLQISKQLALSSNVKVGEKLNFGPMAFVVVSIANKVAKCQLAMDDDTGTAQFDLSEQFVQMTGMQAAIKIAWGWLSITANVQLVAA